MLPSLEREARRELTEKAETHAVEVFARNLRNLLLQPPLPGKRVLAIDPGYKNGCKLAVLDEFGALLVHDVIYVVGSDEQKAAGRAKLAELIREHNLNVVAIGNGTACRQTEQLVAEILGSELADEDVHYVVVNEAGASVYSTSEIGREEFPAVRRDPAERDLDRPPAAGSAQRAGEDRPGQHRRRPVSARRAGQAPARHARRRRAVVRQLRRRRAEQRERAAAAIRLGHESAHGPARVRASPAERAVPQPQAAAGSERPRRRDVRAGGRLPEDRSAATDPLDATWIHPENYEAAEQAAREARRRAGHASPSRRDRRPHPRARRAARSRGSWPTELGIGRLALDDMIEALCKPGRDPREDLPPPIFRKDVVKFEDLQAGMELRGTVLNVVDFGAFVDVGLSDSGLVHISQLSAGYVRDPHDVVAVGDQVRVWVASIDKERRRVALTMIAPGTEKERPPARTPAAPQAAAATSRGRRRREGAAGRAARKSHRSHRRDRPPHATARPSGRSDATTATAARRSAPAPTKSEPPKRSCRSPRKWKKAKSTCAPSATCCNSTRRSKSQNPTPTARPQPTNRTAIIEQPRRTGRFSDQ